MKEKDGGPAFPRIASERRAANGLRMELDATDGMSLRDYFAVQFMARAQSLSEDEGGWDADNVARCCYDMADAMLKAREQ